MFEDKPLPEIGAALAGDRFDSLQEAINKAQVVEEREFVVMSIPLSLFFKGLSLRINTVPLKV